MDSEIFRDRYDKLSPECEIILPEIWDSVVKPGWVVELRFWNFRMAGEVSREDREAGVEKIVPVVRATAAATRQLYFGASPETRVARARGRTFFRRWLGGWDSTVSVALR